MHQMRADQIGGAIVRRTFKAGDQRLFSGMRLTREQVLAFPTLNRNSLAEKRYIDLFPITETAAPSGATERFVISGGFGKFHVIEGKKLNDEPLSREQAYALAGQPEPPKVIRRRKQ